MIPESRNDCALDPGAIDCETRDGEIARRNILFGLWAGARLGLVGDDLERYAWSVHFADRDEPGHDDVIAKVTRDLAARGIAVRDRLLREQLREMRVRAALDLSHESKPPSRGADGPTPACNA
jgi:hypothetical protein